MLYKKLNCALALLLCLLVFDLKAQVEPHFPSPNAASLGRYGQVPVNLYTGKVQVGVPLHVMECGSIKLPISLDYYMEGLKPNEAPGWVGVNWSLSAGGAITRAIKKRPDESTNGYFAKSAVLAQGSGEFDVFWDGEPDFFYFNFGSYSGKFIKGSDGAFHVIPYRDFKIVMSVLNENQSGANIWEILVTTPDGVEYAFGTPIGTGNDLYLYTERDPTVPVTLTWYLRKITARNKVDAITFEYTNKDSEGKEYYNITKYFKEAFVEGAWVAENYREDMLIKESHQCYQFGTTEDKQNTRSFLKRIVATNGDEVLFSFSTFLDSFLDMNYVSSMPSLNLRTQKLDKITITGLKTFDFTYGNFKRLFLTKLTENSNAKTSQVYSFDYYNEVDPDYPSYFDHWGYYNANTTATSLIPVKVLAPNGSVTGYGPQRNPNSAVAHYGMLKKINYPTKGYNEFVYESHTYGRVMRRNPGSPGVSEIIGAPSLSTVAGGVRIKKVIAASSPDATNKMETNYVYSLSYNPQSSNTNSSGILGSVPEYHYQFVFPESPITGTKNGTMSYYVEHSTSNSILPLSYTQGNHVGYSEVTEVRSDGGYTVNRFTSFDSRIDQPARSPITNGDFVKYAAVNSLDLERGQLYSSIMYNAAMKKVREKIFRYTEDITRRDQRSVCMEQFKPMVWSCPAEWWTITMYDYYYYPYYLVEETEINFDAENTTTTLSTQKVTTYKYNSILHRKLTETTVTGSKAGEVYKTTYKYPHDFSTAPYPDMVSRHIVDPIVEQNEYLNTTLLKTEKNNFLKWSTNVFSPSSVQQKQGAGAFWNKVTYDSYDTKGNLLKMTDEAGISTAYIWSYNGRFPTAKVLNAATNQIAYTSFETWTFVDHSYSTDGGWNFPPYILTADYKTGIRAFRSNSNITRSGFPQGDYILNFWAKGTNAGSQVTVGANGANVIPVTTSWKNYEVRLNGITAVTLIPRDLYLDELRIYPVGAQMTTYTYKPLVGVTFETSPNNIIKQYEYDEFGRLINIKDTDGSLLKNFDYQYRKDY